MLKCSTNTRVSKFKLKLLNVAHTNNFKVKQAFIYIVEELCLNITKKIKILPA